MWTDRTLVIRDVSNTLRNVWRLWCDVPLLEDDVRKSFATRRDVSLKRSWRFNDGVSYNLIDTRVTSRDVYDACYTTW